MSTILDDDAVMNRAFLKNAGTFNKAAERINSRFAKRTTMTKGGPGGSAASEMAQKRDIKTINRISDQSQKMQRFKRNKSSYIPFYEAD